MAKNRTNLWDYLRTVAEERTERVEARQGTKQQQIDAGTDINAILKDAVSEYGDDVISAAMGAASAYTGIPMGASSASSSSSSSAAAPSYKPATMRAGVGRPVGSSSKLPSWAPYAGGALVLGLLLSRKG